MSKSKDHTMPTQVAWNGICGIMNARDQVKAMLTEVEDELKDARRELDELGASDETSKDFQVACARKERAERQREVYKTRLKTLADKSDQAIKEAIRGENKLFEDFDPSALTAKPTNKDLYGPDPEKDQLKLHDQPVGGEVPNPRAKGVGHPGKVKGLGYVAAEGVAEQLNADIKELGFDDAPSLVAELIVAGYPTVGHLAMAADKHEDGARAVLVANGFTAPIAELIAGKLARYRTAHRKADRAAEAEAKGEKTQGAGFDTGGIGVGTAKNTRRGKGAGGTESVAIRKAPRSQKGGD